MASDGTELECGKLYTLDQASNSVSCEDCKGAYIQGCSVVKCEYLGSCRSSTITKSGAVECVTGNSCLDASVDDCDSITCSGDIACQDASIMACDDVQCGGWASCNRASVQNCNNVHCSGPAACQYASIEKCNHVECSMNYACFSGTLGTSDNPNDRVVCGGTSISCDSANIYTPCLECEDDSCDSCQNWNDGSCPSGDGLHGNCDGIFATPKPMTPEPTTPSPTTAPPTPPCFSSVDTVKVFGRGIVQMRNLQVGDHVLTSSRGRLPEVFEPVYAFGHHDPHKPAKFIQIYRNSSTYPPLEATAEHLVFLYGKSNPVPSGSIQVGDTVLLGHEGSAATVTQIHMVERLGIFSPLTPSGTIVVNGVVASTYNSLQSYAEEEGGYFATIYSNQDLIHLVNAPFRLLCMGVSSTLCLMEDPEDGLPYYISVGNKLSRWAIQQSIVVQIAVITVVGLFSGFCAFVESVFGSKLGPLVSFLVGMAIIFMKRKKICMKFKSA
jgi:hypothetical protein